MPIRPLPPLLINQIAAGEVIERPASVVKELVENAIDAGARMIDIDSEDGGTACIRVADDGAGIPPEELVLALSPHATSKLATSEDLEAIATMGFRGEALASIASVSRTMLFSCRAETGIGATIDVEGGSLGEAQPAAGSPGTTVTVRNLFFNTPARRKFLKTLRTETGRITQVIRSMALAHPDVAFTYRSDGVRRFHAPSGQSHAQRIYSVLGKDLVDELLPVSLEQGDLRLRGMAGTPDIARATSRHQHLILNGRSISDRGLGHALREAYRGLIDPRRYPTVVLYIEMDPALVDVNVHPTKAEVRFRHQDQLYRAVLHGVRDALQEADLTPVFALQTSGTGRISEPVAVEFSRGIPGRGGYAGGDSKSPRGFNYREVSGALDMDLASLREEPASGPFAVREVQGVMQVHATYLVMQDEEGLVIIDQHALHERVMFEKLMQRIGDGPLESQRFLSPLVLDVDPLQVEAARELESLLDSLGIELAVLGPRSVGLHSFPTLLIERRVDPGTFIQELLDRGSSGLAKDREDALHVVIDMMACKAAIKAGDRLQQAELEELLAMRSTIERSSSCPHGRPTSLKLTIEDLDRKFGRT